MRSTPKFYLKDNKAQTETSIMLTLKIHGKLFRYSTQKTILPDLWDKSTQRPTKERELLNEAKKTDPRIKLKLDDIKNRIENMERDAVSYLRQLEQEKRLLKKDDFKAHLDSIYRTVIVPEVIEKKEGMNDYIEKFVTGIETGEITVDTGRNYGKKYRASTVKTWKEWRTQFFGFQTQYRQLDWNDIDMIFYNNFIEHYFELDYKVNTVGKLIKNVKAIMRRGYDDDLHDNAIYLKRKFRTLQEEVDNVTLTMDEVQRIFDFDVSSNDRLQRSKDAFLIGCYTALRVSDIKRLNQTHIKDVKGIDCIAINTLKTSHKVAIPINTNLRTILERYDNQAPHFTEQYVRADIKDICKEVGIDDVIELKSSRGGKEKYENWKKYEKVSIHTARRTAITNWTLSNLSQTEIAKMSGHMKESTLKKYVKISEEENALSASENSFFK